MDRIDDIMDDDDFRVLGKKTSDVDRQKKRKHLIIGAVALLAVAAVVAIWVLALKNDDEQVPEEFFDRQEQINYRLPDKLTTSSEKSAADSLGIAYTEHAIATVNDITLDIYIPRNAIPQLALRLEKQDSNVVFSTQAADVRADNWKIVGAFVLRGEPLAWGKSKKGYCAIIDGQITIGMAENSTLFEEATERGGYFFRQYPLVSNGVMIENAPKGKSIRKALCERNGEIFVAMTSTPESFHDFAQALADFGVRNAIYLVGSSSYGYWIDVEGVKHTIGMRTRGPQNTYENDIQWVAR